MRPSRRDSRSEWVQRMVVYYFIYYVGRHLKLFQQSALNSHRNAIRERCTNHSSQFHLIPTQTPHTLNRIDAFVGIVCVQTGESQDYFSKYGVLYVNKYDFRSAAHGDCCDCLCDVHVH